MIIRDDGKALKAIADSGYESLNNHGDYFVVMTMSVRYIGVKCQLNMKKMAMNAPLKTERIDVRANLPVKQLLQEAARACHKTVSEFLLDAGITAANQTLADRRRFELDDAGWQQFQQLLDRPVSAPGNRMKALLTKPGVLD